MTFDLYVDVWGKQLVRGPDNATGAEPPKFVLGDTPSFRVYLLTRTTTYPSPGSPFTIINNSGLSLKMGMGLKDGTAGGTLQTQQFTWTADAENHYFEGTLPLNTTALGTLVGTATSAKTWWEVEFTQAGVPTTVLQLQVTIEGEVIETGSITTPAGLTALSAEEAYSAFLAKTNTGFIIQCATDTTKKVFVYVDASGNFHADPVS